MSFNTGDVVDGQYEVRRLLGRGGQGEVYEVFDAFQHELVALKLLDLANLSTVWDEAQTLTALRGPFILPVRGARIASGLPLLVTELAVNGTLEDAASPIGVGIRDAIRWTQHACRGASRTHDLGFIHRDIKPGNLFLDGSGGARLGDFGLVARSGAAPWAGTPETMSPEVCAGGDCSVVSDVYSLGATLFHLLTGRYAHPRPNPDPFAAMAYVVSTPAPNVRDLAPHVSQALGARVARAMAPDPADRYPTPAAFDADLGCLPYPGRAWTRSDEHPVHSLCWRGASISREDVTTCALPAPSKGRSARFDIETRTVRTGRRVTAACSAGVRERELPRRLRNAMQAVP